MEIGFEVVVLPKQWIDILDYLKTYPNYSFSSSRISKVFGISSYKASKIMYMLYLHGYVTRRERGSSRVKSFYKFQEIPDKT